MKLIAIVAGLVALAGAVYYMKSEPLQARVDRTVVELTEWTPERMRDEPDLYLHSLNSKTEDAVRKLQVQNIANSQKLAEMEIKHDDAKGKLGQARTALESLKGLYRAGTYPAAWQTMSFADEGALKNGIVSLGRDIQNWEKRESAYASAQSRLLKNDKNINSKLQQADTLLAGIETKLELLAIEQIGNELDDVFLDMKTSLVAISAVADQPQTISVTDVSDVMDDTADDKFFEELMTIEKP